MRLNIHDFDPLLNRKEGSNRRFILAKETAESKGIAEQSSLPDKWPCLGEIKAFQPADEAISKIFEFESSLIDTSRLHISKLHSPDILSQAILAIGDRLIIPIAFEKRSRTAPSIGQTWNKGPCPHINLEGANDAL